MRTFPLVIGMVVAGLALSGCKREPKDHTIGDYVISVPSGWSVEVEKGEGMKQVTLESFWVDATCSFTLFEVPVNPDDFVTEIEQSFSAKNAVPATFQTKLGTMKGSTFEGTIPAEGAVGTIAQLAGTPYAESYAMADGEGAVALTIITFSSDDNRKRTRERCADAAKTLRRASAAADARP